MAVRAALPLLAIGLVASTASAQDANARADDRIVAEQAIPPEARAVETRAAEAVAPPRGGGGAGAVARRAPPPPLTPPDLQAALENARPEVRQCLQGRAPRAGVVVRARIDARRRVTVRVTSRPRDPQLDACVDLAVRRWVQPLAARWIPRTVTAILREQNGGVVIPPPPPPPPPPPFPPPPNPGGLYDESQVHAALDAMRASILECVTDLSPGIPGSMTLRVTVHPDGTMTLVGVGLPSGVRGPGALACLSSRVALLHVPPPPADRSVVHSIDLGRR